MEVFSVYFIDSNAELLDVLEGDVQHYLISLLEAGLSPDFQLLSIVDFLDLIFRVTTLQVYVFPSQEPHFHDYFFEIISLEELFERLRIYFLLVHQDEFQNVAQIPRVFCLNEKVHLFFGSVLGIQDFFVGKGILQVLQEEILVRNAPLFEE